MSRKLLLFVISVISVSVVYLFLQEWGVGFNSAEAGSRAERAEASLAITKEAAKNTTASQEPAFFFEDRDFQKFERWSLRHEYKDHKLPRVLIFTWATEDTFERFVNETYWKACYAHTHGFDLMFTSVMNLEGVARWDVPANETFDVQWYSEENMWAWVHAVQPYMFSGKYDYVFVMAADVLINPKNLEWPVWLWDKGHDITVMDDHYNEPPYAYGFNQNNELFKPTNYTKWFLSEFFEFRKGFHLQGDNGPYMEALLIFMGYEAVANGKRGYDNKCLKLVQLPAPNTHMLQYHLRVLKKQSLDYDLCFFPELDRLAGQFGSRRSRHIGFHRPFFWKDGPILPAAFTGPDRPIGPWANCWSNPRRQWINPQANCFAYHWNGVKANPSEWAWKEAAYASQGLCPDPTFDWGASPWNFANRGQNAKT